LKAKDNAGVTSFTNEFKVATFLHHTIAIDVTGHEWADISTVSLHILSNQNERSLTG